MAKARPSAKKAGGRGTRGTDPGRPRRGRARAAGTRAEHTRLALFGGAKAVTGAPPPWPTIDEGAVKAVVQALKDERLGSVVGGTAGEFEKSFAKYHGRKYALMANGGTAALQLALAGCGIEPGDEVITTPYSWGASAGCILHQNAVPIFADIHPETLCLDPSRIEERITERTKAILPVHIYGMPADMAPIQKVARKHDLAVIEDCSQAAGAKYRSKLVGTWSTAGAFSLQASKNLVALEGGILITNDRRLYQRAMLFGCHPVRLNAELHDPALKPYIDSLGFNFRPHPLGAALAKAQLPLLSGWIAEKNRNFARLFARLNGTAEPHGAEFARQHKGILHGYHKVALKITHPELSELRRSVVREALQAEGVPVGGYVGVPIPLRPRFRDLFFYGRGCPWTCRHASRLPDYAAGSWPVAERLCREGELIIHRNHYAYSPTLMDQYATAFEKLLDDLPRLHAYAARKHSH